MRYPLNDPDGVPLINYNLSLITLPIMLAGAIYGVAVNKWLPDSLVAVALVVVLVT